MSEKVSELSNVNESSAGSITSENEKNIPISEATPEKTMKITPDDDEWPKDENGKPISKNQMRKRKRLERLMEIKRRKKQQDKDAKHAKAKAEGRDLEAERKLVQARTKSGEGKRKRDQKWNERFSNADNAFKICIDCSFEDKMTTKEIGSLSNQIRYCYAANKKSAMPIHFSATSLSSHTFDNLKRVDGFPEQWCSRGFSYSEKPLTEFHSDISNIVYLSSESEHTMDRLDNSKVYVIGGIVDRNRHKGLTMEKAKKLGMATAKLPIDEHLKLFATKVLTCNHVFEILLHYQESQDWLKAMMAVLPARKDITVLTHCHEKEQAS